MKTIFVKPATIEHQWFIIDATGKTVGEVAVKAASIARGKMKPFYTPHQQVGDFVIIINSEKAVMTGGKEDKKMYYRHSGFMGGLTSFTYRKLLARKGDGPMRLAVKGMLPKGPLGNSMRSAVKIYAGSKHPHQAQKPIEYKW